MKNYFIVNPVSGKVNAMKTIVPRLCAVADEMGIAYEVKQTEYAGHATKMAQEIGESGEEARLFGIGGDGTLNELFSGAYPYKNLAVGCIPGGSGNDFIRSFGAVADFEDFADVLAGGTIPIDLFRANDSICASIACTGMDAKIAYDIPLFRRVPLCGGTMAYTLSIIENIFKPIGYHLRVEVDGQVYEDNYIIATVCNGKAYGGGYYAAPGADLQDGTLEVILVKKISRLKIPRILGIYKEGKHLTDGEVIEELRPVMQHVRGKSIKIDSQMGEKPIVVIIDGEGSKTDHLYAEVMPQAANFVLPQKILAAFAGKVYKTV